MFMYHSNLICTLTTAAALGLSITSAPAQIEFDEGVPSANPRTNVQPNVLAPGLALRVIARGTDRIENPSGLITKFGYLEDGDVQAIEPSKTEPDENTYVVLDHNPGGPQPHF